MSVLPALCLRRVHAPDFPVPRFHLGPHIVRFLLLGGAAPPRGGGSALVLGRDLPAMLHERLLLLRLLLILHLSLLLLLLRGGAER